MHADFSRHPVERTWIRELNILLYCNNGWMPDWGGRLDLEHLISGKTESIDPIENRLVIMLTKSHTLHGYKLFPFLKENIGYLWRHMLIASMRILSRFHLRQQLGTHLHCRKTHWEIFPWHGINQKFFFGSRTVKKNDH